MGSRVERGCAVKYGLGRCETWLGRSSFLELYLCAGGEGTELAGGGGGLRIQEVTENSPFSFFTVNCGQTLLNFKPATEVSKPSCPTASLLPRSFLPPPVTVSSARLPF